MFEGKWTVVAIRQALPLLPEYSQRMPSQKFIASLEADQNEARDGQTATVTLSSERDGRLHESAPQTLLWVPIGPGYPFLAVVDETVAGWPAPRPGRYEIQVAVDGAPVGSPVEFFMLSADGSLKVAPRAGLRRRGHRLEFGHFAEEFLPNSVGITFQNIEEFRRVARLERQRLRGVFGGAMTGGTGDGNYVRTKVEVRSANGAPVYTSPDRSDRLTTVAEGHLKGAFFGFDIPLVEVPAPHDYTIALIADGKDAGSIEFPILLYPPPDDVTPQPKSSEL